MQNNDYIAHNITPLIRDKLIITKQRQTTCFVVIFRWLVSFSWHYCYLYIKSVAILSFAYDFNFS